MSVLQRLTCILHTAPLILLCSKDRKRTGENTQCKETIRPLVMFYLTQAAPWPLLWTTIFSNPDNWIDESLMTGICMDVGSEQNKPTQICGELCYQASYFASAISESTDCALCPRMESTLLQPWEYLSCHGEMAAAKGPFKACKGLPDISQCVDASWQQPLKNSSWYWFGRLPQSAGSHWGILLWHIPFRWYPCCRQEATSSPEVWQRDVHQGVQLTAMANNFGVLSVHWLSLSWMPP